MSNCSKGLSRRAFTATAGGFVAGLFATRFIGASAQEASPVAGIVPIGYANLRLRVLFEPEGRAIVNEQVISELVPAVETLDGYGGYLLGDLIDNPVESIALVVFEQAEQFAEFTAVVQPFVERLAEYVDAPATRAWEGDILMSSAPASTSATPAAVPDVPLTSGYVAVRVHTSLPGTDPRDFVPLATSGFLPIVSGLAGFLGYLWFPFEGGFVAISLFDSEASALASNEAAKEWAAENLTAFTDGNPEIINTNLIFADLPILNG